MKFGLSSQFSKVCFLAKWGGEWSVALGNSCRLRFPSSGRWGWEFDFCRIRWQNMAMFPCSSKVIDMAEMSIQLRGTVALPCWITEVICCMHEAMPGVEPSQPRLGKNWPPKWDSWFFLTFSRLFLPGSIYEIDCRDSGDALQLALAFKVQKRRIRSRIFKCQHTPSFGVGKNEGVRMLWRCCEADAKCSSCTSGNLDVEVNEKIPLTGWRFSVQKPPENGRKGWDFYEKWCFGGESCVFCLQHDVCPSAQDEAFGWSLPTTSRRMSVQILLHNMCKDGQKCFTPVMPCQQSQCWSKSKWFVETLKLVDLQEGSRDAKTASVWATKRNKAQIV